MIADLLNLSFVSQSPRQDTGQGHVVTVLKVQDSILCYVLHLKVSPISLKSSMSNVVGHSII